MVITDSAKNRLKRRLFGQPLPRHQEEARTVPSFQALPILSSDALSSVAYATDAALGVLILAGSGALSFSLPITITIVALIAIVVFSYRQTIEAYPQGGGAYVVGRENLGTAATPDFHSGRGFRTNFSALRQTAATCQKGNGQHECS